MSQVIVFDDTDLPVLTNPEGVGTGESTANLAVAANKDNGTLYWVVTQSATPPSSAQVQAGEDHTGSAADDSGNQAVAVLGEQNAASTGLSTETDYWAYFVHVDISGNVSAVAGGAAFTTEGDATAPILTGAEGDPTSSTTATLRVTTDEGNGTLYGVVTTSASSPSKAQVKAGQDHTGATAVWAGSQAVFSIGEKSLSATGLTAATTYYAHFMHEDASANQSDVVSSASFDTWPAKPSNQTFNANDTWEVPAAAAFYSFRVHVYGGGGGGGGGGISSNYLAPNGNESRFNAPAFIGGGGGPVIAGGGRGAEGRDRGGAPGIGGVPTNGEVGSESGETGEAGTVTGDPSWGEAIGGEGGDCPGPDGGDGGGSPSGTPTSGNYSGTDGSAPGGGGGGGCATGPGGGGGGGGGAYARMTYNPGDLSVGLMIGIVVGAAVPGGSGWRSGGDGAAGRVVIEWLDP